MAASCRARRHLILHHLILAVKLAGIGYGDQRFENHEV